MSLKFGDKVYLSNPRDTEQHYKGLIGVITEEPNEDGDVMVFFKGDYESETRDAAELKLMKVGE
jgi:hypothetical protein